MNNLQYFVRNSTLSYKFLNPTPRYLKLISFKSTKNEENKTDTTEKKTDNKEAVNRLNDLLLKMEENVTSETKLNLAKPKKKSNRGEKDNLKKPEKEKNIQTAAREIAESIGGDVKQTESELLLKLLSPVKSENQAGITNISDIVKGMKIDRKTKIPEQKSRAEQVKQLLQKVHSSDKKPFQSGDGKFKKVFSQKREIQMDKEPIDLFGSAPLGIFDNKTEYQEGITNKTWNQLHERELKLAVTHPPSNYFQQMILWTEQGKIWKFPINNEQGLEEEENVYFAEHIFLEKHLEPWCPPKGPIRHFMELVCVGLSKNPHITVETKREHIEWYKNYFEDKKKLLQEVGAIPVESKDTPKQIE